MRIKRSDQGVKLWLSGNDTYNWAHQAGNSWPCSQLSGKRLFVEYDVNGDLVDVAVNNNKDLTDLRDLDNNELNAIVADHVPQEPITINI